ncbi:MAG: hypothetical protein KDA94_07255, partial [Acidimicrobiales bacterium]|nr:hypothetical protein [Acidimicrobiales bacterium]
AAASGALALVSAGFLAVHLAPRYDELHTLSHLGDEDLGALWRSYRQARDTLPPSGYVVSWLWATVFGSSLLAARSLVVVSWGVAAATLSVTCRRAGPWAAFVAGLVPSATSLLYLGAFARPYAPALAAAALGVASWHRSGEVDRRGRWLAASAASFAVAASLHYLVAAVALGCAVASVVVVPAGGRRWSPRATWPVVGAVLPLVASAPLYRRAAADQGRLARSVRSLDVVAFWPSVLRPMVIPVTLGVAVTLLVAVVGRRRRPAPGSPRAALDRELLVLAMAVVVLAPVGAVVAMAMASGTYVHRYGVGALVGASLLAAAGVATATRSDRRCGPVLAGSAVLAVAVATSSIAGSWLSASTADALPRSLGLDREPGAVVLVLDEYELLLLRRVAVADGPVDLVLAGRRTVADAPPAVDPDAVLRDAAAEGRSVLVVGDQHQVQALLRSQRGWRAQRIAETSYRRPGVDRVVGTYRLERR